MKSGKREENAMLTRGNEKNNLNEEREFSEQRVEENEHVKKERV